MALVTNKKIELALQEFNDLCENIRESTPIIEDKDEAAKKARIKDLTEDYAAFILHYFPHYATAAPAKFHIKHAKNILNNKKFRGICKWFRGSAKSVTNNIFIPLWLKARGEKLTLVLVGKSEDDAKVLLSDIQAELESNQRYIHDFGEQISIGEWTQGKFSTKDGSAFYAKGRGQSPRGLRKRQNRPNYIIIDDIDDDELVKNQKRVKDLVQWILEALMGTMDMGRGRVVVNGNEIGKTSVVNTLCENEMFIVSHINVYDKEGKLNYPEKYTIQEVEEIRKTIGERAFQKEYMNNPIVEGSVFKQEWIRTTKRQAYSQYAMIVCYIDPSLTGRSGSDFKAAVILGKTKTGHFHILGSFCRRSSINVLINWLYEQYSYFTRKNATVLFYIESVFAQDYNIRESLKVESKARKLTFPLRSDSRAKPDKYLRVEGLSVFFENGTVFFDEDLLKETDTKEGINQLLGFERGSTVNDDYPDAMEGAHYILQWKMPAHDARHKAEFHKKIKHNDY